MPVTTPATLRQLDLIGLNCPMPVLRLAKALKSMRPGERLRLTATDPLAAIDIPHFCNEKGHPLISQDGLVFVVECGPPKG